MNNLKLPNPKMMDVAVPANMHVGLHQDEVARKGWMGLWGDDTHCMIKLDIVCPVNPQPS